MAVFVVPIFVPRCFATLEGHIGSDSPLRYERFSCLPPTRHPAARRSQESLPLRLRLIPRAQKASEASRPAVSAHCCHRLRLPNFACPPPRAVFNFGSTATSPAQSKPNGIRSFCLPSSRILVDGVPIPNTTCSGTTIFTCLIRRPQEHLTATTVLITFSPWDLRSVPPLPDCEHAPAAPWTRCCM